MAGHVLAELQVPQILVRLHVETPSSEILRIVRMGTLLLEMDVTHLAKRKLLVGPSLSTKLTSASQP